MKFSVLLPTRNRLKYLKYAIASVLNQDYDQWEIVVSDNDSEENIYGYVKSLDDSRIKYVRTKEFLSVTENWNNALNHSSGEYVIMLGDDDILLKGYFTTVIQLLRQFNNPNLIYSSAYIYTYPGVSPKQPEGMLLSCNHYPVFNNATEPFWLSQEMAMNLVQGHLNFNALFGTNMQYILVKQSQIQKLKVNNQFFHSPYPDVYAMNILLLETENILICPKELVAIGVTPKSTGNFLINNKEKSGMSFLNISKELASIPALTSIILPGSYSLTCWLISMEAVKLYFKDRFNLVVNYKRYRLLQIEQLIKAFFSDKQPIDRKELLEGFKVISIKEKVGYFMPLFFLHFMKRFSPKFLKHPLAMLYNKIFALSSIKGNGFVDSVFSNIFEIFERHDNGKIYSDAQIKTILEEAQSGMPVEELCKMHDISLQSLKGWKAKDERINAPNVEYFKLLMSEISDLKKAVEEMRVKV